MLQYPAEEMVAGGERQVPGIPLPPPVLLLMIELMLDLLPPTHRLVVIVVGMVIDPQPRPTKSLLLRLDGRKRLDRLGVVEEGVVAGAEQADEGHRGKRRHRRPKVPMYNKNRLHTPPPPRKNLQQGLSNHRRRHRRRNRRHRRYHLIEGGRVLLHKNKTTRGA